MSNLIKNTQDLYRRGIHKISFAWDGRSASLVQATVSIKQEAPVVVDPVEIREILAFHAKKMGFGRFILDTSAVTLTREGWE